MAETESGLILPDHTAPEIQHAKDVGRGTRRNLALLRKRTFRVSKPSAGKGIVGRWRTRPKPRVLTRQEAETLRDAIAELQAEYDKLPSDPTGGLL